MNSATPRFIDTHCHLDFNHFDSDRQQVIENAASQGVKTIIVPSVAQSSWADTIKHCEKYKTSWLALGLHPVFIEQHQPQHLSELDNLINTHKPIAVGEIGLDYYLRELNQDKQRAFFSKQLIIAKRHAQPVIIHNRKAHDDGIKLLREHGVGDGIIHAFNGSIQQAEKYIEMGFLLGFGGMLTYPRSSKLRNLVQHLPLESMVLETDAPDMTVVKHRGERNSPEYLPDVAAAITEIKGVSIEQVAQVTTNNVLTTFPSITL